MPFFNNTDTFYFASIRRNVAAFATLFDAIHIQRYSGTGGTGTAGTNIRVPLAYAETQKWLNRNQEFVASPLAYENPNNQNGQRFRMSLPRISFELAGLQPDPARKLQSTSNVLSSQVSNPAQLVQQFNPVPMDIAMEVNIAATTIDDGLQIVEQIIPTFVPSYSLQVIEMPEIGLTRAVPVIFADVSKQANYEGSYEEQRMIIWTMHFVMKSYLYPNITNATVIKEVIANIKDYDTGNNQEVDITSVNPLTANWNGTWSSQTEYFETPTQLDSNGNPIKDSNGLPTTSPP